MRNKCTNPNHTAYKWYGARGIGVCKRWDDFAAFLEDVGEPPGPGYSLDRIENDGNYEPGNVRWATAETQANNKPEGVGGRGVRLVEIPDGRRMSVARAARETGISIYALKARIFRKWPKERLFETVGTTPPGPKTR